MVASSAILFIEFQAQSVYLLAVVHLVFDNNDTEYHFHETDQSLCTLSPGSS